MSKRRLPPALSRMVLPLLAASQSRKPRGSEERRLYGEAGKLVREFGQAAARPEPEPEPKPTHLRLVRDEDDA